MSLIQQALERAQKIPHTTAVEREDIAVLQARQEEENQLKILEKKIEEQKVKEKRQKWILKFVLVSFCIAAVCAGVFGIYFWARSYKAASPTTSDVMSASILSPMTPMSAPQKKSEEVKLVLTGITSSGGVRYALINNQVVTAGDQLKKENVTIKNIEERKVLLEQNGQPVTLSLDPNS